MTFTVLMDETEYALQGPQGEQGGCVPYGQPAALSIDGAVYYALITDDDFDNDGDLIQPPQVFCVDSVSKVATKTKDTEFVDADSGEGIALVSTEDDEEEEVNS